MGGVGWRVGSDDGVWLRLEDSVVEAGGGCDDPGWW